jgi:hypothetical protein
MQNMKSTLAALGFAVVVACATVSPALAGEVTGKGKPTGAPKNSNSICSYSGQNGDPGEPLGGSGRTAPSAGRSPSGRTSNSALPTPAFNPGGTCQGGSNFRRQP